MMSAIDAPTSGFLVDNAAHALRFVRDLDVTPEEAFSAWTDPEQVAEWWDPTGERLAVCEIDLKPGGTFRFVSSHHPDKPFTGTYREISPPGRLVFHANGALGSVTLVSRDGGTRMSVEIICSSAEHLQQFVAIGVAEGTSRTLDNLAAHLSKT